MKSQVLHTVWCIISGGLHGKFDVDHSQKWKGYRMSWVTKHPSHPTPCCNESPQGWGGVAISSHPTPPCLVMGQCSSSVIQQQNTCSWNPLQENGSSEDKSNKRNENWPPENNAKMLINPGMPELARAAWILQREIDLMEVLIHSYNVNKMKDKASCSLQIAAATDRAPPRVFTRRCACQF